VEAPSVSSVVVWVCCWSACIELSWQKALWRQKRWWWKLDCVGAVSWSWSWVGFELFFPFHWRPRPEARTGSSDSQPSCQSTESGTESESTRNPPLGSHPPQEEHQHPNPSPDDFLQRKKRGAGRTQSGSQVILQNRALKVIERFLYSSVHGQRCVEPSRGGQDGGAQPETGNTINTDN